MADGFMAQGFTPPLIWMTRQKYRSLEDILTAVTATQYVGYCYTAGDKSGLSLMWKFTHYADGKPVYKQYRVMFTDTNPKGWFNG